MLTPPPQLTEDVTKPPGGGGGRPCVTRRPAPHTLTVPAVPSQVSRALGLPVSPVALSQTCATHSPPHGGPRPPRSLPTHTDRNSARVGSTHTGVGTGPGRFRLPPHKKSPVVPCLRSFPRCARGSPRGQCKAVLCPQAPCGAVACAWTGGGSGVCTWRGRHSDLLVGELPTGLALRRNWGALPRTEAHSPLWGGEGSTGQPRKGQG